MKKTQSQIGKLSRRKGKSFERTIANIFTQATGLKWVTTRNSGRTDLRGDIYCPELGREYFIVECKHRKEYELPQLMANTKSVQQVFNKLKTESTGGIVVFKTSTSIWFSTVNLLVFKNTGKNFFNGQRKFWALGCLKKIVTNDDELEFKREIMDGIGG